MADKKTAASTGNETVAEVIYAAFGEHPEDVICTINTASETFSWLQHIFTTIKNEALRPGNGARIQTLAAAGEHLAFDASEYAGWRHETMIEHLRAAGVAKAKAKAEVNHG